jgi:excisionase family DNA binding protein
MGKEIKLQKMKELGLIGSLNDSEITSLNYKEQLQIMDRKVLSIKEVAEILDVSTDTIRRAIKSMSLKAFQINKKGNWKITIEELERFMRV